VQKIISNKPVGVPMAGSGQIGVKNLFLVFEKSKNIEIV